MNFNPNRVPNLSRHAWRILLVALALLLLADLFVHHHEHFGVEDRFGFYAFYGFIASAGLVIVGNLLGKLIKRPQDYYQHPAEGDEHD